jgi:hypothetical protein
MLNMAAQELGMDLAASLKAGDRINDLEPMGLTDGYIFQS